MQHDTQQDNWKRQAAEAAVALAEDGMLVGLGTGSTASMMIQALGRRVQAGLQIKGAVPTSNASANLARSLNIPVTTLEDAPELDLDIDGADEINERLFLIKGGGGALLREKVVASASKQFIVIADASKLVPRLGLNFPLPIEVIPFAIAPVTRKLEGLGAIPRLRIRNEQPFVTDNGNLILDCAFPSGITDPLSLDQQLHWIVGIVESGLFLNMASKVFIAGPSGLQTLSR